VENALFFALKNRENFSHFSQIALAKRVGNPSRNREKKVVLVIWGNGGGLDWALVYSSSPFRPRAISHPSPVNISRHIFFSHFSQSQ
jgi:hypothetical protein